MENEFKASEDWLSSIPLMDDTQAGSLRRILNLAAQLPDDWSGMQGLTTLQEDFGALRFQLAFMSFALGLTHMHLRLHTCHLETDSDIARPYFVHKRCTLYCL